MIVDDHVLLGEMLANVLSLLGTSAVAITPTSLDETCDLVLAEGPDVVIVDFHLGEAFDATALIAHLRETSIPVLVVTGDGDDITRARCLEAGASAVLTKGLPTERILEAVRQTVEGRRLVGDAERFELVSLLRRRRSEEQRRLARYEQLTAREAEVLGMLCDGLSAADIAEESYVALTTVRSQIRAILMKLGVSSQLAACAIAHRDGWVSRPTPVSSTLTMTVSG